MKKLKQNQRRFQTAGPIGTKFGTHVQIHNYGNGYTPKKMPLDTQGVHLGVLGEEQLKNLGKLSDWHQLWFTSADSSGNGHRLNTSRPSVPQVAFRGGGGVSQI